MWSGFGLYEVARFEKRCLERRAMISSEEGLGPGCSSRDAMAATGPGVATGTAGVEEDIRCGSRRELRGTQVRARQSIAARHAWVDGVYARETVWM
jgi:hypothetical protein